MDLTLNRLQYRIDGIFGELRDIAGTVIAVTLEHAYALDNEGGYYAKVLPGEYTCVRGIHQLDGMPTPFETFEITHVPNHFDILFHSGNFNEDSAGCVLLGETLGKSTRGQMVTNSKATFNKFMALQSNQQVFTLTVNG